MRPQPSKPSRYRVEVREWNGWRLVARVWHVEQAARWLHELRGEGHKAVRVVLGGEVIEAFEQSEMTE